MAIVKMAKFNLLVFNEQTDDLLKKLQDFNYVHFNDLKVDENENYIKEVINSQKISDIDQEIQKANFAIELLEKYKESEKGLEKLKKPTPSFTLGELNQNAQNFNFDFVYNQLKDLEDYVQMERNALTNDQNIIEELKPWQKITLPVSQMYDLKSVFIQTGSIQNRYFDDLMINFEKRNFESALIERVGQKQDTSYMIAVSTLDLKDEFLEFLRENGFSPVKIRSEKVISERISEINDDISLHQRNIEKTEEKIKDLVKYLEEFEIYQAYLRNKKVKELSVENFIESKRVRLIEGYIPLKMKEEFKKDVENVLTEGYNLEINEADKNDPDVPIILENNRFTEPFESLTSMYSLPRYNEIDPTPLFAPFYALFTGFMVGDIGYGLILTLAVLYGLKKLNVSPGMRKTMRLFLRVGISATIWGIIFGSFFGGVIKLPALIDPQKDYNTLIVLSLIIGVVSMFFALGIKGYMQIRDKDPLGAVFDVLFWYMAVGGAILSLIANMGIIPKHLTKIMLIIMVIGMIGIVCTGGREEKSVGGKIGWGVYALYGITSWVGELVSFLRLMALVLSGGFVAYAINMICQMLVSNGIIGIIFSVVVFLLFQGFNMFLAYLSAYVHSARLIFVEMFNKFYEGGGKAFKEMIEDTNFINITRGGK